ncbi:uncharacterized protein RSE6_14114 [Rhynchosporium secalis]|uniref:Uncharacterized protein n=1 Tax=Rhynchosporium secalis TaxID=38038 RepID=A0A1E1MUM2_RHYSE|nr:uncharacterized protein RSE6_14114 [Rhynchosporium secalis]
MGNSHRSRCILLSSAQTVLIGVTQQGRSYQWDITTGALLEEQSYLYQIPDFIGDSRSDIGKAPSPASLSSEQELLALAYRNSPVCVFDFGSGTLISWIIDENNRAAEQIIFNPNPEVNQVAVAYNESHLALYEPWSGTLITSVEAQWPAILSSVTCAFDGRTLATVDFLGHLRLWDFESLALLYHVSTPSTSFSLLTFTSDAASLVDLGNHEMRIWAPLSLVRKTVDEETSVSDGTITIIATEGQYEQFQFSKIKVLIAHEKTSLLLAGNYNGDILVCSCQKGFNPSTLHSQGNIWISCLTVSHNNLVASGDVNAIIQIRNLVIPSSQQDITASKLIFETSFSAPISSSFLTSLVHTSLCPH